MNRLLPVVLALLLSSFSAALVVGQETAVTADDYPKLFKQWRQNLARFSQLRQQYQSDPAADKKALQAEADKIGESTKKLMEPLFQSAKLAYAAAPNQDKQLTDFLIAATADYINTDDYEKAAETAKLLIENNCDNEHLDLLAGIALFNANEFLDAEKHLQAAKDKEAINRKGLELLDQIDKYKKSWPKESQLRAAEDQAGDLPKVKLETSAGDIVVVLFENEAPNTVANFISLVEKGYYNGLAFHRVIPGFMAQGGDPKGDGSGGPGYTIPDEVSSANHREHFRGSLSMAKTQAPDSGGSQFFICFVPTGHLDGMHTVFGRVVQGMDVLAKLQRTEGVPGNPEADKILKATVLSKRPHEYKPRTQPDK